MSFRNTQKIVPYFGTYKYQLDHDSDLLVTMMNAQLNPQTSKYEFFGPPGALLISIGAPSMIHILYFACSEATGGCPSPYISQERVIQAILDAEFWKGMWDMQAFLIYLAWYTFCVLAWMILPGDYVEGTTLRTGKKIKYKINGMFPSYDIRQSLIK